MSNPGDKQSFVTPQVRMNTQYDLPTVRDLGIAFAHSTHSQIDMQYSRVSTHNLMRTAFIISNEIADS